MPNLSGVQTDEVERIQKKVKKLKRDIAKGDRPDRTGSDQARVKRLESRLAELGVKDE